MAEETIEIEMEGYWRDQSVSDSPSASGVYAVYAATYNSSINRVALHRLLYIGEAANVRERLLMHERYPHWKARLGLGEELCFSVGRVHSSCRERVEAAFIFEHKPPLNTSCTMQFNYDRTTVSLTGACALLSSYFCVEGRAQRVLVS